jgi:ribosome-binding factor A
MKPFSRADRVSGQIRKVLSELLQKEIKDPRLEMATITGVKMSADLKNARIYFVISGASNKKTDAAKGFQRASGYIKRTLASQLGLRYMPNLKFYYDDSFDYGDHIETLLKKIDTDHESNNKTTE